MTNGKRIGRGGADEIYSEIDKIVRREYAELSQKLDALFGSQPVGNGIDLDQSGARPVSFGRNASDSYETVFPKRIVKKRFFGDGAYCLEGTSSADGKDVSVWISLSDRWVPGCLHSLAVAVGKAASDPDGGKRKLAEACRLYLKEMAFPASASGRIDARSFGGLPVGVFVKGKAKWDSVSEIKKTTSGEIELTTHDGTEVPVGCNDFAPGCLEALAGALDKARGAAKKASALTDEQKKLVNELSLMRAEDLTIIVSPNGKRAWVAPASAGGRLSGKPEREWTRLPADNFFKIELGAPAVVLQDYSDSVYYKDFG